MSPRGIAILGCTGSIGQSTLAVVGLHPGRFRVAMLGAHSSWQRVVEQALRFEPDVVVLVDPEAARQARSALAGAGSRTRVESGVAALSAAVDVLAESAEWFVLTGSVPADVPPDIYARLIVRLKSKLHKTPLARAS